jgi:hypothetical protein
MDESTIKYEIVAQFFKQKRTRASRQVCRPSHISFCLKNWSNIHLMSKQWETAPFVYLHFLIPGGRNAVCAWTVELHFLENFII